MVDRPICTVLVADDNLDDCEMVREAWTEVPVGADLKFVYDGTELLDYLYRKGQFSSPECSPYPSVILLDLNMPKMTGGEVLAQIKQDPSLAWIPIVILTTSRAPRDISWVANFGVNGYIQKPNYYGGYLQVLTNLKEHWREILECPLSGMAPGDWSGRPAWC